MGDLSDILHELEPSLGSVGGEPVPLEGGITNRNFKVSFASGEYVVRLHGRDTELLGISREAERLASERAAALGIAPALAGAFPGGLVTRFIDCEPLPPGGAGGSLVPLGRALRRFHDSGLVLPTEFRVPELVAGYALAVAARGGSPPAELERAQALAERISRAVPAIGDRPCHNDLLPGNLLQAGGGEIMIVDWEYAAMGHPYFDLGNLAVNNELDDGEEERLLTAYLGQRPSPAQAATLKLMRIASDVREAAWGVMQGSVSDLGFDFDAYARRHFARLEEAAASPHLAEWLTAAGG